MIVTVLDLLHCSNSQIENHNILYQARLKEMRITWDRARLKLLEKTWLRTWMCDFFWIWNHFHVRLFYAVMTTGSQHNDLKTHLYHWNVFVRWLDSGHPRIDCFGSEHSVWCISVRSRTGWSIWLWNRRSEENSKRSNWNRFRLSARYGLNHETIVH